MFDKKRFFIGTAITVSVSLVIATIIYLLKSWADVGAGFTFTQQAFRNVIDGLTLSGLLGVLTFCLSWLSREGAFDIISYSVKLFWYNTFRRNIRQTALPKTYADYKELKHGDKKESVLFILIGSLPCLITGIILLIPYNLM